MCAGTPVGLTRHIGIARVPTRGSTSGFGMKIADSFLHELFVQESRFDQIGKCYTQSKPSQY